MQKKDCNFDSPVTISSNTLFHFTESIDHIISILKKDFRPNLSLEDLSCLGLKSKLAIPMVSFCDIPLSQTLLHMKHYGCYGIGLSKSWGKNHGINPVLYTYQDSPLAASICKSLAWTYARYLKTKPDPGFQELLEMWAQIAAIARKESPNSPLFSLWDQLLRIQCFVKPYEGPLGRGDQPIQNVRFYDEREWRFVPDFGKDLIKYLLIEGDYNDEPIRRERNNEIQKQSQIPFTSTDIKYLIVSCEEEILPMIKKIEEIAGSRYSHDEMKIFNSKIITADQIATDF